MLWTCIESGWQNIQIPKDKGNGCEEFNSWASNPGLNQAWINQDITVN